MASQTRRFLLICLCSVSCLLGEEAHDYLGRTASTYKRLKSFQVESIAEKRLSGEKSRVLTFLTLYVSRPGRVRVETKDSSNRLRSVLMSNGAQVTEYRAWTNEYTPFSGREINVTFSPERGVGVGEMLYDTIADGIHEASIRGRQTVEVGSDRIGCVVIDVEY